MDAISQKISFNKQEQEWIVDKHSIKHRREFTGGLDKLLILILAT